MSPERERAAWTLAGWLGAAMIAVLTLMLGYIGSAQNDIVESMVDAHRRIGNLEQKLMNHERTHVENER